MSGSEYLLWSYGQFEKMTFFPPDPLTMRLCRLSSRRPGAVLSFQLVVASPLVVLSLRRLLVFSSSCRASWLMHHLSPSSHCAALLSSCHASWLSHCLSPSSRCATLLSTCRVSLLLYRLSLSSCCAPRHPLILSSRWLVVTSPHDALPSRRLIVSSCRLSLSCRAASRCLVAQAGCPAIIFLLSSGCTALSSSHRAGWLLRCLSLRRPLVLLS
jgi:hypothetical protein